MQGVRSLSLCLLAACGIALRGRISEVVDCSEARRPSQIPRGDGPAANGDEACCALPDQCFVLQPVLHPVGLQMEMWLALRHPPAHVAAALAAAYKWDCLLEFGPHCLADLAAATKATARARILNRGLHVPGNKRRFLQEIPLAVWRATSGTMGHLELADDDARAIYAGQCKLSAARNDGLALREVHHPFLVEPGAAQKAVSADHIVAADWPPLPADSRNLPSLRGTDIRSSTKPEDVAECSGRTHTRLLQLEQQQEQSLFWLAADAGVRGPQRFSGALGEDDMICAPTRSVSRNNIALTLRGDRCQACIEEAQSLQQNTAPRNPVVHPYAASFLKVVRAPGLEWDEYKNSANAGKRFPVYVKLPRVSPSPWFPSGANSMVQCSVCGASGQLPRMLAHIAICRAGAFGRVDAATCRKLASLASPDGQNAEGGSSRAPAAKTTSQDYDLAQLRVTIPAAASPPAPDTTWSRGLQFRVLVLNAGRCLQSSWPLLVHEIRGILPLVVVVSEAEIPDAACREKIQRLIQWALQGRYKALLTQNALVLVAHSLRPAPNTELAEIVDVPDMVAAVVAHTQIAGLLVLGYLPPTGAKRAIWGLFEAAGLSNCLDEQEVTFPYAESQPDVAFLKPRPGAQPLVVYAEVEPPSFMKLDGSSHLRITAGIRNPPERAASDLPTGRPKTAAEDAALERRFIWATETAPGNLLNKAADACVAAAANRSFSAATIAQELQKAGVRRSKARPPPAPSMLFTSTGALTVSTAAAMGEFKGRLCDGRPAGQ
eukprot:g15099.t1